MMTTVTPDMSSLVTDNATKHSFSNKRPLGCTSSCTTEHTDTDSRTMATTQISSLPSMNIANELNQMIATLQHKIASLTYDLSVSKASLTSNTLIISDKTAEISNLQSNINKLQTTNTKLHNFSQSLLKQRQTSDQDLKDTIKKAHHNAHQESIQYLYARSNDIQEFGPPYLCGYHVDTPVFSYTHIETFIYGL
mmetsp:Transcript_62056/g.73506  ORF Transcript_62056/g.73506 Transcript_62056/m.73506 type:complete len:194 (-) Transcript_62056:225-806(-)